MIVSSGSWFTFSRLKKEREGREKQKAKRKDISVASNRGERG